MSVSTVSRVLNGSSLVDEKTRDKVQAAIKKLNYRPNLLAYSLRARSSRLISLILPELTSIHASFLQQVEESCMERGYSVMVGLHRNDCEREKALIDEFQRRNGDGLILYPAIDGQNVSNNLMEYISIPVVLYEHSFGGQFGNVTFNNYEAGAMAARYLLKLGHRNLACTVGPMGSKFLRDRFWGFYNELKKQGLTVQNRYTYRISTIRSPTSRAAGRPSIISWRAGARRIRPRRSGPTTTTWPWESLRASTKEGSGFLRRSPWWGWTISASPRYTIRPLPPSGSP